MRGRITCIFGRHSCNRHQRPRHHPDPSLPRLFGSRRVRVRFVFPLLLLILVLSVVSGEDLAAKTQAHAKTTITILPIQEDKHAQVAPIPDIAEQRLQVERLQLGIKEHEDKIKASQEKGRGLLDELERIDATLTSEQKKLTVLQESLDRQEKLLTREQRHLDQALADKQELQTYVQNRLTAYYQMGGIGLMNILFSKKSLSELLSFQEYFQRLLQYDRLAINSYQNKITELTQVRRRHEVEEKRLRELVVQVQARKETLNATRQEKQTLLTRVRTEEKLYQQAVTEIQKAAAALSASLAARSRSARPAQPVRPNTAKRTPQGDRGPPPLAKGQTFLALKGKLGLPAAGPVVTNHDGLPGKVGPRSPLAGGIDIMTAKDEPIRAIYDGTVITSGYLRGYGNMIIIDHGQHYYSLVARAGEIFKEEGTTVHMGEVIGITGDSDALIGRGLHFEIRHGSAMEDPLEWLDRSRLDFTND
jgi:septal ring factor EnvC (AmiA/AmiB activator)